MHIIIIINNILLLIHVKSLLLLILLLIIILHHHLLLLRSIIISLPLLLWKLLLILHKLLWIIPNVIISLILSTICICIEILLLLLLGHILEVHKLLSHHVLHVKHLSVLGVLGILGQVWLHLLVGLLLVETSGLEVEIVTVVTLELHCSHVHWLKVWEGTHVWHLHVLEVLHVLININRSLLLHKVLWPILLWILLLDKRRLLFSRNNSGRWSRQNRSWLSGSWHLVLLDCESYYVDGDLGLLLGLNGRNAAIASWGRG